MNLRTRITLFVLFAVLLLAAGLLLASLKREGLAEARAVEAILRGQDSVWRSALDKLEHSLRLDLPTIETLPEFGSLVEQRQSAQLTALLLPTVQRLRIEHGVSRVDLLDQDGRLLYSSGGNVSGTSIIDAGLVIRILDQNTAGGGVALDENGRLVALAAEPVRIGGRPVGLLGLATPVEPLLADIRASTGSEVVIVDPKGKAIGTNLPLWHALSDKFNARKQPVETIAAGAKDYEMAVLKIADNAGALLGYQVAIRDVSESYRGRAFIRTLTMVGIGCFFVAILLLLHGFLRRSFRPFDESLAAINALSAGQIAIEIEDHKGTDEIGRMARAVRIFRDHERDRIRQAGKRVRQQQRQQRFIRHHMLRLAETLDERARQEVLADLDKIESASRQSARAAAADAGEQEAVQASDALGTLAMAFQYMIERVRVQHQHLDALIAELREALQTRTELIGLQQQLDIAGKMQAGILPKTLPPRDEVEVQGQLLPAKEFGGDFYDFFFLDEDRLALAAGQVSSAGLATAFYTVVTRTLLKAVALSGFMPAQCLKRANDMLVPDNEQQLTIGVFFGILDLRSGHFTYCNGGYAPPLLLRRIGEVVELPSLANPPLAIDDQATYGDQSLDLPLRSTLLLASAGVFGDADKSGDPFNKDRLMDAMRECDDLEVARVLSGVITALQRHEDGAVRTKDASCVAVRWLGG
jgi:sigma-B regulation protein RsbU (phosphoserine phosphatase)